MSAMPSNWSAKSWGMAELGSTPSSLALAFLTLVERSCKGESACAGKLEVMNLATGEAAGTLVVALVGDKAPRPLLTCTGRGEGLDWDPVAP